MRAFLILLCLTAFAAQPANAQRMHPVPPDLAKPKSPPEAPQVRTSGVFDGVTVFRNVIMGLSREDVRRIEKLPPYKEDETSLHYVYKPDEFRRTIRYDFENDKLVRIHHAVVELHYPHFGRTVDMYYDVQRKMSELYGEPADMQLFWKNKKYEKYPDYWGRALFSGDLRMMTLWTPPGVTITLDCYHDGNQYHMHYTFEPVRAADAPSNAIDLPAPAQEPEQEPRP